MTAALEPGRDCPLCPRLVAYREEWRAREPLWHNAPVPTLGALDAKLLVVGLAPGLRGANRTGRPFTADFAGDLLYPSLLKAGFATGTYERRPDDGLVLVDCAITNAARCVPPQNKPTPGEIGTCRRFLAGTLGAMPNIVAILALGRVAHESVVRTFGARLASAPFAHGRRHHLPYAGRTITLYDSYHCSRYNTSTRLLTAGMFEDVVAAVRAEVDDASRPVSRS
jgi:uracil-DNA glycosylase